MIHGHLSYTQISTTLTDVINPKAFLSRCTYVAEHLDSPIKDDPVLQFMKTEARNMLHRADKNEENFASFLEGAGQKFIPFNPAGHLGRYGAGAIRNLKDLRERQIIVFIMTPLSHMREFSDSISLINHNIIAVCKAKSVFEKRIPARRKV